MVNRNYIRLIVGLAVHYGLNEAKQCAEGWANGKEIFDVLPEGGCITKYEYDQLGYVPDWSYAFFYIDE